ncbi:Maleamate amidohydrolase [Burkholderia gladioli]|uniref:Isochorismatase family protein n=1 Tax=Burkholderia gladioli TaxID=28095 RepID=A0AAW3ETD5_BURGA|nr:MULTISPECIES: isochorismatase family protein [Burkholderia]AJW99635.1 isochorismatase family protein [Burkholderia gladioli]KAF1064771.1 Maleamate amidohydrolase [Burkholderia gladioli]KGC10039.1 isochorismatase family protein [Burkholderia gladioli]CAG9218245.1 Maleamate amidohydrolase [Burkholderia gladioli]SPV11089.1 isochorismatase hydrolase [Burkholderia gladioli]
MSTIDTLSRHAEAGVYRQQGFGTPLPPAGNIGLLIIDLVVGFADPATFGGGNIPAAIARTRQALAIARERGWPVAHSRIVYAEDGSDDNVFSLKVPGMATLTEDHPNSQIVPELAPAAGELVVRKQVPSAFFGTQLAPWLTQRAVRTLLVAGAVTSGCVRASVVDAMSFGFRPFVLSDCVGDRAIAPHEANLFDMAQKYAAVMPLDEAIAAIEAVQAAR